MMTTTERASQLAEQINQVSREAEKIGVLAKLIAWSIPERVMLRRADVLARVEEAGLPLSIVTAKLRERVTVLRALKALDEEGFLHPVALGPDGRNEDNQRAVWILVTDATNRITESVEFQEKYRFTYYKQPIIDPNTGVELVQGKTLKANNPEVQQELNELVEHFSDLYLSRDVRALMTRAVKAANGLPFRDHGGVYILPRQKLELVEAMERFLTKIPGCEFRTLTVPDLQKDRDTLFATFDKNFNKGINEIRENIVELVSRDRKARRGVFEDRMRQVMDKMGQLNMFSELLQFKTEEYETALHELREFVFEQME